MSILRHSDAFTRLLDALVVGGNKQLLTVDDWCDHLARQRRTAIGRWFMCALVSEWHSAEPPTPLCAEVADHVQAYLSRQRGDWVGLWTHIERVTGYAGWLAERRGMNRELVYLACILHDVRKLDAASKGGFHEELGADYADHLLAGQLAPAERERIVRAIGIHPDRPPAAWPVACALHDADKLDKVGTTGLLRRVSAGDDREDACDGAWRMLDDTEFLPALCFSAAEQLLAPKLRVSDRLSPLITELCD